jgi:hypothetical protein
MNRREAYAPRIARIIADTTGRPRGPYSPEEIKLARLALRREWQRIDGMCRYHPYRIWCDEARRQLGIRPPTAPERRQANQQPDERQPDLWGAA